MRAEIICIGTELLMGQTINTNAAFLGEEFQSIGLDSFFQTTVGDNTLRVHEVLEIALNRSDVVITTGGLGPTPDDLTHEAIFTFIGEKSEFDKKVLNELEKKFKMHGYKTMPPNNKKQALKPKSAKWITNKFGTANGIIWEIKHNKQNKKIITFPGVPGELKQMWLDTVKPYLQTKLGKQVIVSQTLRYTGIGESALAEKIKSHFNGKNPTVAPYASIGEVKIRVSSKAKTKKKAIDLNEKIVKKIKSKTHKYLFSENDESLEETVASKLLSKQCTIAIAESCTGGLLAKRLTDITGSSKYLLMSCVTYSNKAKVDLLGISNNDLKKYGAVSSQIAQAMAKGIKKIANADISISITGIAGPTGNTKDKPIGLVYFGLATKKGIRIHKVEFGNKLSRYAIRTLASQYALNLIRKHLL